MIAAVKKCQPELHNIAISLFGIGVHTLLGHSSEPSGSIGYLREHLIQHRSESIYIFRGIGRRKGIFLIETYIDKLKVLYILGKYDGFRPNRRMNEMICLDILYGIDQLVGYLVEMR